MTQYHEGNLQNAKETVYLFSVLLFSSILGWVPCFIMAASDEVKKRKWNILIVLCISQFISCFMHEYFMKYEPVFSLLCIEYYFSYNMILELDLLFSF